MRVTQLILSAFASIFFVLPQVETVWAQGGPLPGGFSSDAMAWIVLSQVMSPSGNSANSNVEFETWAADGDIYTPTPQWPGANASKVLQVSALSLTHLNQKAAPFSIVPNQCIQNFDKATAAAAGFPKDGCIGEEVRRNWASYQYIVGNHLNTKSGLKDAFSNHLKVDFPSDAIEVKADWARISDVTRWLNVDAKTVRDRYYTNKATAGGTTEEYALLAFHFSTKQVKNWLWADFENQFSPGRCDDTGCHDSFGALNANVASLTPENQQYGECKKTQQLMDLLKAAGIDLIWANYCLKGSQIAFRNPDGTPSILGNSVIERINAGVPVTQSSCVTCHAYASFGSNGKTLGPPDPPQVGDVDQSKLNGLLTNDFVWGNVFAP